MAETSALCEEEEVKPQVKWNGRYKCPWTTWEYPNGLSFVLNNILPNERWADVSEIPSSTDLDITLPVCTPDIEQLKNPPSSGVQATWIGHATVLVQLDGINVLTDPVFSDSTGPVLFGYKRFRMPACTIEQLPSIDAVVISHNHFDHLDANSVGKLNERFGEKIVWYVPKGIGKWMKDTGCRNIVELTWWEQHGHHADLQEEIQFVLTPAQHWSGRAIIDTNESLWGSWVIKGPRHSFFFAGDTGYCDIFKQIGKKYGPFDLSAIPIGAYYPRHFMEPQHINPKEAVDIHLDVKSKNSVGIHWGTFKLTKEYYLEPRDQLKIEAKKAQLLENAFITVNHGITRTFGGI
ncbi:N-acyl-phosphatidylethanolamine-hydrolyzing phospholipase D-like [Ylistrum balloti]|uniref:N-acyl-phosphatidylethanolamine-hydrolyzing phospholipase D-like n=1 Tax=Ylistrum balloti TaxID=509963 RepID=UPI002905E12D|nr:N-acyl-phosphatidylethanolamine-hydrolyzing phospholipase D-like [Ylistrum balloti]XP_060069150.1 N-acyl-phosphatidylethanolamine-hydrolyzing phospholipase D-like [Ylistrum balloti]XP_060069152.1 N-acyl-phosphatidylethanolamine-hydrolyzing phospholipase D-like [Ylistrum balloti]